MADNLSREHRRKTMQAVKGRGTSLERRFWSMLENIGLQGWTKNADDIIGKPDVVFHSHRIAVFIDGCFWHGCPQCRRKLPKTNPDYWNRKISRNIELAQYYDSQLHREGWTVLRFWEHEMTDIEAIQYKINQVLQQKAKYSEMSNSEEVTRQSQEILSRWLVSCTRRGKISRNTIAVGIVVLDHLLRTCPIKREDIISPGGEVKGARSGLVRILEAHGLPNSYLKEVTTRQGHQDGQRLLNDLNWGQSLASIPEIEREKLLQELIDRLKKIAVEWLTRSNLNIDMDRRQAPTTWINIILTNARGRSGGIVEQQLVGAKLARQYTEVAIPNHPVHAGDLQTDRAGDFVISSLVYHVTGMPTSEVLQKCRGNLKSGFYPILLVPREQILRAQVLAQDERIEREVTIISIEDFIALNIVEMAVKEGKNMFSVLQEIVDIYNRRLSEVETDLSLRIDICRASAHRSVSS